MSGERVLDSIMYNLQEENGREDMNGNILYLTQNFLTQILPSRLLKIFEVFAKSISHI